MLNGSYCQATLRSVVLSRLIHGISRYSYDVWHRKRLSGPKIYWIYIVPEDICKLKHWRKHLCVIPSGRTCDFAFLSLDCYYQSPFLLYDPESAQANWLNNNCLRPGHKDMLALWAGAFHFPAVWAVWITWVLSASVSLFIKQQQQKVGYL